MPDRKFSDMARIFMLRCVVVIDALLTKTHTNALIPGCLLI